MITPLPLFADCCEANIRPAMCLPSTMLPTTRTSNDGNGLSFEARATGPPWTKSAHVIVLAGIWMTMLHGTTIVVLLIVTVPPQAVRPAATSGHALLSALTVASWMKPVSSKPWMSAGATLNSGSARVGVTNGDVAPGGRLGRAAPPLAKATAAPATTRASPRTTAIAIRAHPFSLRFLLLISAFPRVVRL